MRLSPATNDRKKASNAAAPVTCRVMLAPCNSRGSKSKGGEIVHTLLRSWRAARAVVDGAERPPSTMCSAGRVILLQASANHFGGQPFRRHVGRGESARHENVCQFTRLLQVGQLSVKRFSEIVVAFAERGGTVADDALPVDNRLDEVLNPLNSRRVGQL